MNDVFSNRDQRLQATVYAYDEKSYKDVGFRPFDNINNTETVVIPLRKAIWRVKLIHREKKR